MTALLVLWFLAPLLAGLALHMMPSRVPGLVALHCAPAAKRTPDMRLVRVLLATTALMLAPVAATAATRSDVAMVRPAVRRPAPVDTSAIDAAWDDLATLADIDAGWPEETAEEWLDRECEAMARIVGCRPIVQ